MNLDLKTQSSDAQGRASTAVPDHPARDKPAATTDRDMRLGRQKTVAGLSGGLILTAVVDSFRKLDPRTLWRNPVMFVVEIVAVLTTILVIRDLATGTSVLFSAQITFWLWFTVVFANFAEAVAEGRG